MAHAEQRHAIEVVEVDRRPDHLEHVGQQRDPCAGGARGLDEIERHHVREAVRTDDHAMGAGAGDELDQRGRLLSRSRRPVDHGIADLQTAGKVGRQLVAIEDRAQAHVGALVADEKTALAGEPRVDALADRAAPEHRADHEDDAQHKRLALARLPAEEDPVAHPDPEDEQRAELAQAGQLLGSRLADPLVVALVEAEDLRDPDGRREEQHCRGVQRIRRRELDRHDERDGERDRVGEREAAPQSPLAHAALVVEALGDLPPGRRLALDGSGPGVGGAGRSRPSRRRSLGRPFVGCWLFHELGAMLPDGTKRRICPMRQP